MIVAILMPFLIALCIPFISKFKHRIHTGYAVLATSLSIFLYFLVLLISGETDILYRYSWIPSLGLDLTFYTDGLALFFALLISGIGALVAFYSIFYLSREERLGSFYVYLLLFMGAMLGIVTSDNIYALYTFWELTSVSSFLLISFWFTRKASTDGALKSMLITFLGGFSLLGGLVLLHLVTGSTSIREIVTQGDLILANDWFPLIVVLLLLAACTKSAQFPFHIWLPDAMEAPTPVSAYLHSATMVKAGLFLLLRFTPVFRESEAFFIAVSIIGLVTLFWGSYMAVKQTDLKGILAYSTISQLGMIMAMIGYGTEAAIFAAIFHILNHATFKGSLFMAVGIIDHETGTRNIQKLGGLWKLMPVTGIISILASFSMAGVPLPILNGFYSKEEFFTSSWNLSGDRAFGSDFAALLANIVPYAAVAGSIFTFVYSMYFYFRTFTGKAEKTTAEKAHDPKLGMLAAPVLLVSGVLLISIFPNWFSRHLLQPAANAVYGEAMKEHTIHFWHGFVPALIMSLIVVVLGILFYSTRKYWMGLYNILPGKLSGNIVYTSLLSASENQTKKLNDRIVSGSIRQYNAIIVSVISIVTLLVLFGTNSFDLSNIDTSPVSLPQSLPELAVALIMIAAAFGSTVSQKKLTAVIILGVVGYGLSILFVLFRAPDLALTQLSIETITVVLFLLCFRHLPEMKQERKEKTSKKITNIIIASLCGLMMMLVGLAAYSQRLFPAISDYFVKYSYKLGGGDNIVNVILVDFRGLDTLFEITVLAIAALGIYSLIKLRQKGGDR
ncbi:hydrogen gas-evolving membrane-bound hydrogenase subunit E [Terribacillus saccharophilus]|uniref:Na+/H+ antiporter subunit A n=1 Tax=Terribacillus saccharophilus TaxID=361277 RepID=A0A268ACM3_9BACI|nr:hydrogen gas-evolving membrane-bound hydrogenase subunit E [Terribacillus saccharophilus]PAD21880.1 Na+/H+ antiporter subunit A [Terribacillus saccharophilus]